MTSNDTQTQENTRGALLRELQPMKIMTSAVTIGTVKGEKMKSGGNWNNLTAKVKQLLE